ncbi:hypothetical protein DMA11_21235 [Marinilabiliaceae bacterium JC017]|nr:hypothetical protein DMA11_21235 [Marinilabiliaceae bacterium JC017]
MSANNLTIGTRVDHPRYGEGIISRVSLTAYEIFFEHGGKMEILKNNTDLEVLEEAEEGEDRTGISLDELKKAVGMVLDQYGVLPAVVELGKKWDGGKVVLHSGNEDLQPKEIPIDVFFHKIVMVRDRLRVLEQNINSHNSLTDEEKVHLQQYITRAYGSLTTFNVLFAEKEDYFVGSRKG